MTGKMILWPELMVIGEAPEIFVGIPHVVPPSVLRLYQRLKVVAVKSCCHTTWTDPSCARVMQGSN
jgi:hypothetical protein